MNKCRCPVFAIILFGCYLGILAKANAECSPTSLMSKEYQTIQIGLPVEIAFVLSATREEFDLAKKSMGSSASSGIILSYEFNEARAAAQKVASAIKFEKDRPDYATFLVQQLSGDAHRDYIKCLTENNKPSKGLLVWFDQRAGEIYILNAMWVGPPGSVAENTREPFVSDGTIEKPPQKWTSGKIERLIWRRPAKNATSLVLLSVGDDATTFRVVGDPPSVRWATQEVRGPKLSANSYHVSGTVCGGGSAENCVLPQKPGGTLIRGTGRLTDFRATETSRATFMVTSDTPDRICVKLTVSTGACEARNSGEGVVTAVEQYPDTQPEAQRQ